MKYNLLIIIFLASICSFVHAEETTEVICSFAPSQSATVNRLGGMFGGAAAGTEVTLLTSGMTIVPHSSGALILAGSGGYVAGTMTGALVASTVVTVGLIVAGTAVTVELACAPKNHPDLVKKVLDEAKEYQQTGKDRLEMLTNKIQSYNVTVKDKFYKLMGETWYERMIRKTKSGLGF